MKMSELYPDQFCNICGTKMVCDIHPRYSTKTGKLKEYSIVIFCPNWDGRGVNHHYFKRLTVPKDSTGMGFFRSIERQTPKPLFSMIKPSTLRLILICIAILMAGVAFVIALLSI